MRPLTSLLFGLFVLSRTFATEVPLPSYEPISVKPPTNAGYVLPDGSVQIICSRGLGGVIERLDRLFTQAHPGVRFTVRLGNDTSALSALTFGATAFAPMAAEATASGLYGHVKLVGVEPLALRVAHGSLNPAAGLSALAVIVNPANSLATLDQGQLTRIFAAGAGKGDYSRWSQLGVRDPLGSMLIHPVGLPESDYLTSEDPSFGAYMVLRKMDGAHFTPTYEMVMTYAEVAARVATDPQAVGLVALNRVTSGVKVVALRADRWSDPMTGTMENIASGQYPLDRFLYLYLRLVPGEAADPFAREYLKLALSREGQAAIASAPEQYLALSPREVLDELAKLR